MRATAAKDLMVVTDTTNPEIDRLNRLLQDAREDRGQLSGPELEVIDLNSDRIERLRKGDRVIFTKNVRQRGSPEVLNGTLGEVMAIDQKQRAALVQLEDEEDKTASRCRCGYRSPTSSATRRCAWPMRDTSTPCRGARLPC